MWVMSLDFLVHRAQLSEIFVNPSASLCEVDRFPILQSPKILCKDIKGGYR
jgi:hypothetical protein